jgi:diguanylate cyclase (GGDEF)-like protein
LARFEMGLVVDRFDGHAERQFHWTVTRRNVKNDGEGRLVTVFGDDISAMRAAERRLAKVFNSIPLGIFTLNRDATIGESFSSCLESMLDCGKLAGAAIEEVLFKPALAHMAEDAVAGIKAIRACLGKSELDYGKHSASFPKEIFHNTKPNPDDGLWLRITYQPIVFNQIVEQLLIILEDRTAIVNAEQEMLVAAQDREKAIALEKQSLAVYESAIRDPLTRLYTRLYMKDAVAALLWKHDRNEIPDLSMAMFDIDHFKKVNDTYGHKSGDLILARVAGVIFDHSLEHVIPIRFGGEEFVVFMPADVRVALAFAETVRKEIEILQFDLGGAVVIQTTISCGVTAHRQSEVLEDFMHRADSLLYQAKSAGRNQSVCEQ